MAEKWERSTQACKLHVALKPSASDWRQDGPRFLERTPNSAATDSPAQISLSQADSSTTAATQAMRGVLARLQIRNLTSPAQISVRNQCPTSARTLRCTLAKCRQKGPSRAGHLARRRLAPHDVGQCLASFLILANTRAPRITRMFILDALGGERHRHLVQRMAWNLLLGDLVCCFAVACTAGDCATMSHVAHS